MQEVICNLEFSKDDDEFIVRVRTDMGGLREFTGRTLSEVLNLAIVDLEDEFL